MDSFSGSLTSNIPQRVNLSDLAATVCTAAGVPVTLISESNPETKLYTCFRWEYEAEANVNDAIEKVITSYSLPDHQDDDFTAAEKAQAAAEKAKATALDIPTQLAALAARVAILEGKVK
jgi:hypothetical protein